MTDLKVKLFKASAAGLRDGSRRRKSFDSIRDGMLRANYKGDRSDLDKMIRNGQVRAVLDDGNRGRGRQQQAHFTVTVGKPQKK
jgi:hypothetical protein